MNEGSSTQRDGRGRQGGVEDDEDYGGPCVGQGIRRQAEVRTGSEGVEGHARHSTGHGQLSGVEGRLHGIFAPHYPIRETPAQAVRAPKQGPKRMAAV